MTTSPQVRAKTTNTMVYVSTGDLTAEDFLVLKNSGIKLLRSTGLVVNELQTFVVDLQLLIESDYLSWGAAESPLRNFITNAKRQKMENQRVAELMNQLQFRWNWYRSLASIAVLTIIATFMATSVCMLRRARLIRMASEQNLKVLTYTALMDDDYD